MALNQANLSEPNNGNRLALKRVAIDTYHENVAYLHRDCEAYRAEGFQALSKVEVRTNGHHILATLNVVDDDCIVGPDEIGLSEEAFKLLGVAEGEGAYISQAERPASMEALFRKINGVNCLIIVVIAALQKIGDILLL